MKSSSSKSTLNPSKGDLDEVECTEVKAYSGSKKKPSAKKKKCTHAITNSTLIESQEIKRSEFATYVEEKLSSFDKRQRKEDQWCSVFSFSTAIFQLLQSIKILTLWRRYLTVPRWFLKLNLHNGKYANTTNWITFYMDFLNSTNWCNILYSYRMIYNIFLLYDIIK